MSADELWLKQYIDRQCCDVVTTGRRSGREHVVELWYGIIDETLYFISGGGTSSDWYANMIANPIVKVKFDLDHRTGSARVISDPDERRRVGDHMGAKYEWDGDDDINLSRYSWCFEVPAIGIDHWQPR